MIASLKYPMAAVAMALTVVAAKVQADINVGVIVSETGPAASIGIPEKNAVALGPRQVAGHPVHYHVLDDRSDTTQAVKNARKLTGEQRVDVILGATTVPSSMAMLDVARETGTSMIAFAPAKSITEPVAERAWAFKTMTGDDHELQPLFQHALAQQVKRVAFIGFADSFGEGWIGSAQPFLQHHGLTQVASERYARTDTSVLAQVMKVIAAKPDAVFIAASSGPAALPVMELRKRGFQGAIYVPVGATFGDFVRIGGKLVDGVYAPLSPAAIAEQLPEDHPQRAAALQFIEAYEGRYGEGSRNVFSASVWDAMHLVAEVIPQALQAGEPGTAAFRAAIRAGLETVQGYQGARGTYHYSATDHTGLDFSALHLGRLQDGRWVLANQ